MVRATGYLLDTNVVSELRKRRRSDQVVSWIESIPADRTFISVVTVGEIAKGIVKRRSSEAGKADADELQSWLEALILHYADRVLPIGIEIAVRWGRLCHEHPQLATDMLIAATAMEHGLTVATRNTGHFDVTGVSTLNPFN